MLYRAGNEYQATMLDEYCNDSWVCRVHGKKRRFGKQYHYRLVLDTAGYSLKRFRGTEELLYTTYDVFHGKSECLFYNQITLELTYDHYLHCISYARCA